MALYIATHKPAQVPQAPWLVQIGLNGFSDEQVKLTDKTGDSISHLNREYCELTATYWLWKNCQDPYIGLCHYRRLFAFVPVSIPGYQNQAIVQTQIAPQVLGFLGSAAQEQRMMNLLEHYEMIVPQEVMQYPSLADSFKASHGEEIWASFAGACRDEFGNVAGMLNVENRFHYGNMLVARADIFRNYCERLFRVLNRVYAEVGVPAPIEGARYQPFRYPGYLGERFMNLYLIAMRTRYACAQSVWFD